MPRTIHLGPPQFEPLQAPDADVQRLFDWLDAQADFAVPSGELSIAFLDEAELARIHGEFLNDPSPTDVITFPGDVEENFAGEILVSAERAANEASKHGNTFAQELTLYLVHGWLHLAGLDDIDPEDRIAMRAGEKVLMERALAQGVIPGFTLDI